MKIRRPLHIFGKAKHLRAESGENRLRIEEVRRACRRREVVQRHHERVGLNRATRDDVRTRYRKRVEAAQLHSSERRRARDVDVPRDIRPSGRQL